MKHPVVDDEKLRAVIQKSLEEFYRRRLDKLGKLKLRGLLKRKNPYLFRALGIQKGPELVEQFMASFVWSSDEGIFGDAFFEKVARDFCGLGSAPTDGIDFVIEDENEIIAISLKSGPNIYNASQTKKQAQEFQNHHNRVRNQKKKYTAILAAGYGNVNKPPSESKNFSHIAGQAFWSFITGDDVFYLKLHRLMGDVPQIQNPQHKEEWSRLVNRFSKEFLADFTTVNDTIDWDKLVSFNSGVPIKKTVKSAKIEMPVAKKAKGKARQ